MTWVIYLRRKHKCGKVKGWVLSHHLCQSIPWLEWCCWTSSFEMQESECLVWVWIEQWGFSTVGMSLRCWEQLQVGQSFPVFQWSSHWAKRHWYSWPFWIPKPLRMRENAAKINKNIKYSYQNRCLLSLKDVDRNSFWNVMTNWAAFKVPAKIPPLNLAK